jgi:broad specificity phosphatase PhoE
LPTDYSVVFSPILYLQIIPVTEMKTMEIILARHGRPTLDHWAWITPRQLGDSIRAWDSADIATGEVPLDTQRRAAASKVIVSSTLRRSMQSAEQLCASRKILCEQLFCEAELPHSNWRVPRLPLSLWGVLFRVAWFCGYSSNAEPVSIASERARRSAERLIDLARQNDSVFLVGHGIMTMLIAKQLLLLGWSGPKRPANKYWQYCVYRSPPSL